MVRALNLLCVAALAVSSFARPQSQSQPRAAHRHAAQIARQASNVAAELDLADILAPRDVPELRSSGTAASRRRRQRSTGKVARCAAQNSTEVTTTTTTTAAASTATPAGNSTAGDGQGSSNPLGSQSLVSSAIALVPSSGGVSGDAWSVAEAVISGVQKLTLTDDTFIVEKNIADLSHEVVTEDGQPAIHAHFDKGSYDLKSSPPGGFSFYSPGPKGSDGKPLIDLSNAKEVSFAYSVKFSTGYDWVQGGKLPGLYGGVNPDVAATCSGGDHNEGCFSTRFMFREDGKGELYLYIPPSQNRANLCGATGTGQCRAASSNGKTYGASIGTGLWSFKDGDWTTVRQVIHLNTPGQQDGWAKVYVNGAADPVLTVSDISYRSSPDSIFVGMQVQTFHGGHDPSWAPDQDQDSWFRDFSMVVTATE